jgi:hypothetical protein
MKTDYPNKSITNEDVREESENLIEYNFPEHGITIKAKSLEEAQKELKKLIEK